MTLACPPDVLSGLRYAALTAAIQNEGAVPQIGLQLGGILRYVRARGFPA